MYKIGKVISATFVVSTLVIGSSVAYVSTDTQNVQAAEKVQKWGHGEGGSGGESSEIGKNLKAETPWYKYEGYTTYDASFTQDYNFVRALKYDNVTIDGYKVKTNVKNDNLDHTKEVYDTTVEYNSDNEVIGLSFLTKPDSVSKATFKKAHTSNEIIDEGTMEGEDQHGTYIKYATNDGSYVAYFDENDNLMQLRIDQ
ncbi:hypothetical protein MHZ36_08280 [Staphylococcus sp. ACRSN]|uniref:immunodominant staphylococcal antigen IsaB family protein n=1 Tax=Staphylococcus sp. ACRSN TaxID=2918214 RepID=UPI001EF20395|nr:hypothetical protein [Staphylococcus sp. ACRSN]MCG7339286.1 hypothetical protein [Staphylococcus sp. ACRSN]